MSHAAHLSPEEARIAKASAERRAVQSAKARAVLEDALRYLGPLSPADLARCAKQAHVNEASMRSAIRAGVAAGRIGAHDIDGERRYFLRQR